MSIRSLVAALLPFRPSVPAEVQREITRVEQAAAAEIARLRARHTVVSLQETADADIAQFNVLHARAVAAMKDAIARQVEAAQTVLPPVVLPE